MLGLCGRTCRRNSPLNSIVSRARSRPLQTPGLPLYAERYKSLARGELYSGPAFTFPEAIDPPPGARERIAVAWPQLFRVDGCRDSGPVTYCGGGRGWTCRQRLLLCPALQCSGRSRTGNGSGVPRTWIRLARCRCLGIGGSSVWPHSALQYVVVQSRLSVGCSQIGSGSVCKRVELVVGKKSTLAGILVYCRCLHLA